MRRVAARTIEKSLFWALLGAGLALRVLGAWWYRHSYNPDYGIVGLMAKRMAEGRGFPVFFYGQAYMGSLEPAVSGLLCRLLGCSGFVVCLGTALIGALLLPVVYAWGRDAGGRRAGLVAMALCLIGPEGYFHYQSSPRGGYATALLLGTLVVWWVCRLACRERGGVRAGVGSVLGVGFLVGLGVWSNWLIVPAVLTAGLALLAVLRTRVFQRRFWAVVPGFILGSLPLWLWNLYHGWQSFAMAEAFESPLARFARGQHVFWTARLPELLDLNIGPPVWHVAASAAYIILVVVAIAACVAERRERRQLMFLGSALLFLAVFSVIFSLSSFAAIDTSRYLLPLVPVLAVTAGAGTGALLRYLPRWRHAAWALPAILLATQFVPMRNHLYRAEKYDANYRRARVLGEFLREHDIGALYAPYLFHSLNFMLGEQAAVVDLRRERCRDLAEAVEVSDRVAVLANHGGLSYFLQASGGRARYENIKGLKLLHELRPPGQAVRVVPREAWRSAVDVEGFDIQAAISDRNLDTSVTGRLANDEAEWIEIRLDAVTDICGVRLLSGTSAYPLTWSVEGRSGEGADWRPLSKPIQATSYFWSGPRLYWAGEQFRLECRFETAGVDAVRVRIDLKDPACGGVAISEVDLLAPAEGAPSETLPADVIDLMRRRGIRRVYADRWAANQVHAQTAGGIWANREPAIFGDAADGGKRDVRFRPDTALLTATADVARVRTCLAARHVRMRETAVGEWTVFDFAPGEWEEAYAQVPGVFVRGGDCVLGYSRRWASVLFDRARAVTAGEGRGTQRAIDLLDEAVRAFPEYQPAVEGLIENLVAAGRLEEAGRLAGRALTTWYPEIEADVEFPRGIRFLGVSMSPSITRPGGPLELRYFWRCPPDTRVDDLMVFVHIVGPTRRFQDDHALLQTADTGFQPTPEVLVEHRRVTVPLNVDSGGHELQVGLYHRRGPHGRLRPRTSLPVTRRAVTLPAELQVVEAD